jgi:hypothetical protein
MLSVLASIAMIVGGVSTTMALPEEDRLVAEESRAPVVEVQAVAAAESLSSSDAHL